MESVDFDRAVSAPSIVGAVQVNQLILSSGNAVFQHTFSRGETAVLVLDNIVISVSLCTVTGLCSYRYLYHFVHSCMTMTSII